MNSVTGEKLRPVNNDEKDSGTPTETIPGQIPFYKFDEEELEAFDPKLSDISSAEDYLKSVILEARQQPDIVRGKIIQGAVIRSKYRLSIKS